MALSYGAHSNLCVLQLHRHGTKEQKESSVARWQNLIPSFPWIGPGWIAWECNPRKGRDLILQRSVAEPSIVLQAQRAKHIQSNNLAIAIWKPCRRGICRSCAREILSGHWPCRRRARDRMSSPCQRGTNKMQFLKYFHWSLILLKFCMFCGPYNTYRK